MSATQPLPPVLCLMGPTASGKTRVAVELAKHHQFEIISVDSALVYRGLDIGSGKPDTATLKQAPHHLVDILDPLQAYSAADFRHDALELMNEIHSRGKTPLLVGGTMLYFKALRDGLAKMPAADPVIRKQILTQGETEGWPAMHQRLAKIDPESALRIHPNDPQRLQRALEVYEVSGKTMTQLRQQEAALNSAALPFNLHFVAMYPQDRAILHGHIEERFHQMLNAGFVDEVRRLRDRGDLNADLPAIRSVGYRQVWEYLNDEYCYQEMIDKSLAATRQLAKRQLTWLRSWPDLEVIDSEDDNIIDKCLKIMSIDTML